MVIKVAYFSCSITAKQRVYTDSLTLSLNTKKEKDLTLMLDSYKTFDRLITVFMTVIKCAAEFL